MTTAEITVNKDVYDKVVTSVKTFRDTFHCQRCGKCCQEGIGVALWGHEFLRLKRMRKDIYKHIIMINDWHALKLPCVFYNARRHKCNIYDKRPIACSMYPLGILPDGNRRISQNCTAIIKGATA